MVGSGAIVFVCAGAAVGDGSAVGFTKTRVSAARVSAGRGSRVAVDAWVGAIGDTVVARGAGCASVAMGAGCRGGAHAASKRIEASTTRFRIFLGSKQKIQIGAGCV